MRFFFNLLFIVLLLVIIQGCNTLYNTRIIDIEILEPARVKIPEKYKSVAVRYNNCNINFNPNFAEYYKGKKMFSDTGNIDSAASNIYYNIFFEHIKNQQFFDTIIELEAQDFSEIKLLDSLIETENIINDSLLLLNEMPPETLVAFFTSIIKKYPSELKNYSDIKVVDPKFGLYSKDEIQRIKDTTGADLLLSLDYFTSLDGISYSEKTKRGVEDVYIMSVWNFYDLHEQKLTFFYDRIDTISWAGIADEMYEVLKLLPPRKDAIFNAADISGTRFSEFLIPHWTNVQRMYYHSGQTEMKKTDQLVKDGKWFEAAEIWKANINNPNKKIVAKSMFNLGLACEMEGKIEAAIEWIVMSYYIFEQKNKVHAFNCKDYIKILSQRKQDIKIFELQMNSGDSASVQEKQNKKPAFKKVNWLN